MAKIIKTKTSVINLESKTSPAILSGLLGMASEQMVYQARQNGKLPPENDATYRQSIVHYIEWHKNRSNSKSGSMHERKMLQEIRNGIAKEEMQWLDIREKRKLLIDIGELAQIVEPVFNLVRSGLVNLAREMPESSEKVDNLLRSWATLGEKMVAESMMDADVFVDEQLQKEIENFDSTDEVEEVIDKLDEETKVNDDELRTDK